MSMKLKNYDTVICGSAGNDSVALVLWMWENRASESVKNPVVIYNETHWGVDGWPARVAAYQRMVESLGWPFVVIDSVGMRDLVRIRGRGIPPQSGRAYCSIELKILPTQEWLDSWDLACDATLVRGIRREESERRASAPRWVEGTGPVDWRSMPNEKQIAARISQRDLHQPLVTMSTVERNDLILGSSVARELPILQRRSGECKCCHYNKGTSARCDPWILPMCANSKSPKPKEPGSRFISGAQSGTRAREALTR